MSRTDKPNDPEDFTAEDAQDEAEEELAEEAWEDGPQDSEVEMEGLTENARAEVEADDLSVVDPYAEYDEGEDVEPGAEGEFGTGVESADQILEDERVHAEGDQLEEFGDFADRYGADDTAAAEQGNRDEDQMVAEGEDYREVAQLGGDDRDIDVIE